MDELIGIVNNWKLNRTIIYPTELKSDSELELYYSFQDTMESHPKTYQDPTELFTYIAKLDNMLENYDANYISQSEIGNIPLDQLMQVHNKYCHKYFDDEDIMIYRMNISAEKKEIINIIYQSIQAKNDINYLFQNLVIKDYQVHEIDTNIGHPHIFVNLWEIMTQLDIYYKNKCSDYTGNLSEYILQFLPANLDDQVKGMMDSFKEETQMNPFSEIYQNLSSLNLEFIILVNLCIKYLKIFFIYCRYHNIKWYELSKYYLKIFLRLVNNFGIILLEVGFNPGIHKFDS